MQRTTTYKLPQWEKSDRIVMEDFNDQAAKLEAALTAHSTAIAAKADQTAVNSLQTQVSAKCEVVFGAYTGDGSASRTVPLGFTPKAVYVCTRGGVAGTSSGSYHSYGGLVLPGHSVMVDGMSGQTTLAVTTGGFRVYYGTYQETNISGYVYHYMAFR